jgi:hypothetical protein
MSPLLPTALAEAERVTTLEELSRALLHYRGANAGAKTAAAVLGQAGAELLSARSTQARSAGAGFIAVAVQYTQDRSLVEQLRRASQREQDTQLRTELEQRVSYLTTLAER